MIGAIIGDIVGSVYEWDNIKTKKFKLFKKDCFFTDDTVLTIALADSIMSGEDYGVLMREYYKKYPDCSYGGGFRKWAKNEDMGPYNSWGNGAAMRISPVGYAYDSLEEVLNKAKQYTEITHNHPEGIKGAQATASAIFLARKGSSKEEIQKYITDKFGYNLTKTLDKIRPKYKFDVSTQGTMPVAIRSFLEAKDFEDAIRNAISVGGDSDTIACITGSIAEAYFTVPKELEQKAMGYLDYFLKDKVTAFRERFCKDIKAKQ